MPAPTSVRDLLDGGDQRIYAVLDTAREGRIPSLLGDSGWRHRPLFDDDLARVLDLVTPYIALVEPGADTVGTLLDEGWGQSWGVFLQSDASFSELRHHLQQFVQVQIEDGSVVFFRFWDPRVLRIYLPTCTAGEANEFFGPIRFFYTESPDGAELWRFEHDDFGVSRIVVSATSWRGATT